MNFVKIGETYLNLDHAVVVRPAVGPEALNLRPPAVVVQTEYDAVHLAGDEASALLRHLRTVAPDIRVRHAHNQVREMPTVTGDEIGSLPEEFVVADDHPEA